MDSINKVNNKRKLQAFDSDNVQPYLKIYVSAKKACPYCDEFLNNILDQNSPFDHRCACSLWEFDTKNNQFRQRSK